MLERYDVEIIMDGRDHVVLTVTKIGTEFFLFKIEECKLLRVSKQGVIITTIMSGYLYKNIGQAEYMVKVTTSIKYTMIKTLAYWNIVKLKNKVGN